MFQDKLQCHNMTNLATPKHNDPFPGSHEIYNFGVLLLGYYCYIYALSLSDPCPGVEKTNLKDNNIHFN